VNFFFHRHYYENPNGGDVLKYFSNLVLKFHDDPMVNESEIVVLWDKFECILKKDRVLEEWEGKTDLREREHYISICS